jgi:hypothetical protein
LGRRLDISKTVDEEVEVSCVSGKGKVREEVWQDSTGKVIRYNLAFINHLMHQGDNGRVLGYDVAHDYHHRHLMAEVEAMDFPGYEELVDRFLREVSALRKKGRL